MKTGTIGLMRDMLMCLLFFTGNYSFAQSDSTINPEIDSSSLTLRVSVRRGCVISTFNEMEFSFYPDSTCLKFYPEQINYIEKEIFQQVSVPINLWSRIGEFRDSIAGQEDRLFDYLMDNPEYTIEFELPTKQEFHRLFIEYKLKPEERMILSQWFDEFKITK